MVIGTLWLGRESSWVDISTPRVILSRFCAGELVGHACGERDIVSRNYSIF